MRNLPNHSKLALIAIFGTLPLLGVGCSSGHAYMRTLREHPDCVDQAQIAQFKVNGCIQSSGKSSFNDCLRSRNVPESRIDALNSCVDYNRPSM